MYRWTAKWQKTGLVFMSREYDDWDECYEDYVEQMKAAAASGFDLAQAEYRGVFTAAEAVAYMLR